MSEFSFGVNIPALDANLVLRVEDRHNIVVETPYQGKGGDLTVTVGVPWILMARLERGADGRFGFDRTDEDLPLIMHRGDRISNEKPSDKTQAVVKDALAEFVTAWAELHPDVLLAAEKAATKASLRALDKDIENHMETVRELREKRAEMQTYLDDLE